MGLHIIRQHVVMLGRLAWRYNVPYNSQSIALDVRDLARSSPISGFQVAP
jgi:hypothetical protein